MDHLTSYQKVAGLIPVWDSEIVFFEEESWQAFIYRVKHQLSKYFYTNFLHLFYWLWHFWKCFFGHSFLLHDYHYHLVHQLVHTVWLRWSKVLQLVWFPHLPTSIAPIPFLLRTACHMTLTSHFVYRRQIVPWEQCFIWFWLFNMFLDLFLDFLFVFLLLHFPQNLKP